MLTSSPLRADDITGSRTLLCTTVQATLCIEDGECTTGPPWRWNIPQLIIVDIERKQLRTTEASGENRTTPIPIVNPTLGNGLAAVAMYLYQLDKGSWASLTGAGFWRIPGDYPPPPG